VVRGSTDNGRSRCSTRLLLNLNAAYMALENAAAVDAFHAAALRAGGQDNGAPGRRAIYGPDYYAASSSIRTDIGSRRITVQPKPEVSPNQNDPLPLAPIEPNHGWAKTLAIIV